MAMIEIQWNPDRRRLRGFGLAATAIFAALGAWVFFRHSVLGFHVGEAAAHATAFVLWALAAACGILAAAAPAALRPLYVGLSLVGLPIGWVVSYVVMGAVYYGLLTPIGLVMRALGRDPLDRRFDRAAPSYWVRRERTDDVKRYFRQF